jgi:ketosteroid isomerase-like protein
MSENLDLVRSIYAAWNAGDWGLEHFSPDVEWSLGMLDQPDRMHGRDALLDAWKHYWGSWKPGARWEMTELQPLGHRQVLACGRLYAVGRKSGVEVGTPMVQLWTVEAGLVMSMLSFGDRVTAMKATGFEG